MGLLEEIHDRIAREGPLTFADFMRHALYGPGGYYSTRAPMGFAGDYLTAPETTPLFGATLSRLASATWRGLGRPEHFEIVDVGAGSGKLLRDLWEALRAEDTECATAAEFAVVEISPAADRAQARVLAGLPVARARSLEALGPISGLVLANEFLDALPFHLIVRRGRELREFRVATEDSGLAFVEEEPTDPRLAAEAPPLADGERAAVPLATYEFIGVLAEAMVQALAVLIDYPSTPRPDVRTYFRHTSGGAVLERVGEQDITAPLDFARLRAHAEAAGLSVVEEKTQAEFLEDLGFGERLRAIGDPGPGDPVGKLAAASARNAARAVVDPEGMGRFSVLVLARGLRI